MMFIILKSVKRENKITGERTYILFIIFKPRRGLYAAKVS